MVFEPQGLAAARFGKGRLREPRRFLNDYKHPLIPPLLFLRPFPSLSGTLSHSTSWNARPRLALHPCSPLNSCAAPHAPLLRPGLFSLSSLPTISATPVDPLLCVA